MGVEKSSINTCFFRSFLTKKFPVKCKYFSHPWRVKVLKKKAFGYWEITARVSYVCAHVRILSPIYYTLLYISLHVLHIACCTWYKIFIPYARHYNPRFVFFLLPFLFEVRFILQTTYGLKTEILRFLSLKSAVYIRERFQIKSGLWWRAYGM